MKAHRLLLSVFIMALFLLTHISVMTVNAQSPITVVCGDQIESVFSSDTQIHTYQVNLTAGTSLVVYAESLAGNYQNLGLNIELSTPRGNKIAQWLGGGFSSYRIASNYVGGIDPTPIVATDALSENGVYVIRIIGYTETGSPYRIFFSCIDPNAQVISSNNQVQGVQCGSSFENTVVRDPEVHRYYMLLHLGDILSLDVQTLSANYQNLGVNIELSTPRGNKIAQWVGGGFSSYRIASNYVGGINLTDSLITDPLPETGLYRIRIIAYTETGSSYSMDIGCTLRDGTIINPGDVPPPTLITNDTGVSSQPAQTAPFSGFGFPGVASRDFSSGIEIPIQRGQSQTAPIGGDVALYTYEASANTSATLTVSRLSGDISIGVAVIKKDTNEILFLGGMPSSNNLSIELTFPSAGTYAIGVFRLDTNERINTSGAVQISLD